MNGESAWTLYSLVSDPSESLDRLERSQDNASMNKPFQSQIPPALMAEMREAADRLAKGIRDPEAMRRSAERMDRIREEIRQKHGILDIGVPAIRELRDAE